MPRVSRAMAPSSGTYCSSSAGTAAYCARLPHLSLPFPVAPAASVPSSGQGRSGWVGLGPVLALPGRSLKECVRCPLALGLPATILHHAKAQPIWRRRVMSFLISKVLPLLVYPIGLACVLLVLIVAVRRRPRAVAALAVVALVLLYLASNHWVAYALMRSLEWRYLPQGDLPAAQAIVVLGGGTYAAEPPRPMAEVGEAGDRLMYAALLYQEGKAPFVLVSGGNMPWVQSSSGTAADDMASLLEMMGVPEEAIWRQSVSRNTYEDAVECARLLADHGVSRILLVTSASHMPRSVALFQKQGLVVVAAPTDFAVSYEDWQRLRTTGLDGQIVYLMPDAFWLETTYRALHEYFGLFTYRLRGWID